MRPDQRPANRPSFEEREAALPVPLASELLLGMFGDETGRGVNVQVQKLIDAYWLYATFDTYDWGRNPPKTDRHTPNSPRITTENVEGAKRIVTATYDHHNLGWGPQQDIVVAQMDNNDIKTYWFPKFQKEIRSGAFDALTDWSPVKDLLRENPKRQEEGVRISLWEKHWSGMYYSMVKDGQYTATGMRLIELLEFLRQK